MLMERHLRLRNLEMLEQQAGLTGVFAGDDIHAAQRLQSAQRDVPQIAYRSRNKIEHLQRHGPQPFQLVARDVFGVPVSKQGIVTLLQRNQAAMPAPRPIEQYIEFGRMLEGLLPGAPHRDLRPVVVTCTEFLITARIGVLRLASWVYLDPTEILDIESIVGRAAEQFFGLDIRLKHFM